jgi:DNA topoisomerase-2
MSDTCFGGLFCVVCAVCACMCASACVLILWACSTGLSLCVYYFVFFEVNAADNKQRDEPGKKGVCMTHLEVTIDAEVGKITVKNDGKGISVAKHEEYPMCIPQLIFGELLTSSNYDDDVKQTVGGRNGFGAKLANIFSRKFVVEIEDATEKKSYRQVWRDNMSKVEEPVLTHYSGKKNSTSITFYPELRRFDMESLDSDILSLLRKRVYDIAGTTPDSLKVFLNGKPLAVPNFKKYTTLYIGDPDSPSLDGEPPRPRVYAALDRRWEVCVSLSNTDQFAQVSFVNNIATARGGSHVSYMSDLVSKAIVDLIGKTKGASKSAKELSAADVKKHLFLFVNALVVNPTFDSQTKTFLTSKRADLDQSIDPVTKKVSKVKVDSLDKWNAFVLSIKKSGLVQEIITRATEKAEKKMSKTDGKLKAGKRITGIPKLEDANLAGE